MKLLTIHGAWSAAFLYLAKMLENRKWKPSLEAGERFALHAGKHLGGKATKRASIDAVNTVTDYALRAGWRGPDYRRAPSEDDRGAAFFRGSAIGLDDVLVDWEQLPLGKVFAIVTYTGVTKLKDTLKNKFEHPPWAMAGQYQWQLEEMIVVPKPVECRGQQGLRAMPKNVEAAVLEQIL